MPPFQLHLRSALRRAHSLAHDDGVSVSLPGVRFAGRLAQEEASVVRLLFHAVRQDDIRHYWSGNECCEGCVDNSMPIIHRIESLVRLTRSALGPAASPVCRVLLASLSDSIREFREYLRQFTPDNVRHLPWGDGSRENYLVAMRLLRDHLISTLRQLALLLGDDVAAHDFPSRNQLWHERAYAVLAAAD